MGGHDERHQNDPDPCNGEGGLGSLRKLPSGRWQARYPAPDGEAYTARTEDDKPLPFLTKTDARTWLAGVHTKIARQEWEPPSALAARRRTVAAVEKTRSIGFTEYADRWIAMMRAEPQKNGRHRAIGTVRSYKGKVDGYLVPEFGDLPVREIDAERIHLLTRRRLFCVFERVRRLQVRQPPSRQRRHRLRIDGPNDYAPEDNLADGAPVLLSALAIGRSVQADIALMGYLISPARRFRSARTRLLRRMTFGEPSRRDDRGIHSRDR